MAKEGKIEDGKIRAEWEPLQKVVIHKPGIEMFFGLLDPSGSLYERAFSRSAACREHDILKDVLQNEFKVKVHRLKDKIIKECYLNPEIRQKLVALARENVEKGTTGDAETVLKEFDRNEKYLDSSHFFNILLMNEGIDFHMGAKGMKDIQLNIIKKQPLSNLYFMRDQQFVTDQGVVLCRMGRPERRNEPKVTKFLWEEVLKIPIVHEIQAPGTIEGGEFIPMGNFALVGIGSRTNQAAIDQLLTIDFDFEELGVVHQPMHPLVPSDQPDPMINMHLDTYFNVAGSNVVVGCELLLKHAVVEVYRKEGKGKFVKDPKEWKLYDFIRYKGFEIVPITSLEQMSYASNFLCIEDKKILAIEVERTVKDVLAFLEAKAHDQPDRYTKLYMQAKQDYENLRNEGQFFPHKKELYRAGVEAYPIILKNLTGGYGGAHCMTCSLSRYHTDGGKLK